MLYWMTLRDAGLDVKQLITRTLFNVNVSLFVCLNFSKAHSKSVLLLSGQF